MTSTWPGSGRTSLTLQASHTASPATRASGPSSSATPDATRIYLKPDGSDYLLGDVLVQADLGRTLRRLAEAGGDDFYTGEIAAMLAADFEQHGGFITADDLRDYRVLVEPPLRARYRGLDVLGTPVPSSGPQLLATAPDHGPLRRGGARTQHAGVHRPVRACPAGGLLRLRAYEGADARGRRADRGGGAERGADLGLGRAAAQRRAHRWSVAAPSIQARRT